MQASPRRCEYCKAVFTPKHPIAKYCGDSHRALASLSRRKPFRSQVLAAKGPVCTNCGMDCGSKPFVRVPPGLERTIENAEVLCGWCTLKISKDMGLVKTVKSRRPSGRINPRQAIPDKSPR